MQRAIVSTTDAIETAEGAGARVRRALPNPRIPISDPFILLDEFFVDQAAGFPRHPHRGFEIVTYVLEGGFRHQDSLGNDRTVMAGGLQKINTGAGIWHSEMPAAAGRSHGLQLWINLPRHLKGADPEYQEVVASEIPQSSAAGSVVRTIVGEGSPVRLHTPLRYVDVTLQPAATWRATVPREYRGFVYVLRGSGRFGADAIPGGPGQLLAMGEGDEFLAEASAGEPVHFVLIAGQPHGESIRLRGSFVD